MLTIEECRELEPGLSDLSDEEVVSLRDSLYAMGRVAFENVVSKNPKWVVPLVDKSPTMRP